MEESASMLCARVMRGTSSMAKKETPARARSRILLRGGERLAETDEGLAGAQQRQVRAARLRDSRPAIAPGGQRRTAEYFGAAGQPGAARWHIDRPEIRPRAPADCSTTTLGAQLCPIASQARGISATRRSPGNVSRGTPIVTATNYLHHGRHRDISASASRSWGGANSQHPVTIIPFFGVGKHNRAAAGRERYNEPATSAARRVASCRSRFGLRSKPW